jgi:hypothetical protein
LAKSWGGFFWQIEKAMDYQGFSTFSTDFSTGGEGTFLETRVDIKGKGVNFERGKFPAQNPRIFVLGPTLQKNEKNLKKGVAFPEETRYNVLLHE